VPADPDSQTDGLLSKPEEDVGRASDPTEGFGGASSPVRKSMIARSAAPGRMEDHS
jgi:hypothetical protein